MKNQIEKAKDKLNERLDLLNEKIDNYWFKDSLSDSESDRLEKWEEEKELIENSIESLEALEYFKEW